MLRSMILAMALMMATTAQADPLTKIEDAVQLWMPLSVEQTGDKVVISIDQRIITSLIYESVIQSGLCFRQVSEPEILDGISEVAILNRFMAQGFVYETGEASCADINSAPTISARMMLLGATHVY